MAVTDVSPVQHLNGRDVYWCYQLNEPILPRFGGDGLHAQCPMCGWNDVFTDTASFLGGPGQHRFICHILKPQ